MTGVLSNCFLFTLLYETAVVETPQSALWPTQNTTERFVAHSKHHKALCGLFKTPQNALWCFSLGFTIENWMARLFAYISQLFFEIIWFLLFKTP